MAIYEYDCGTCGARIEVMQPMGSRPQAECGEDCVARPGAAKFGKGRLSRVFSLSNVGSSPGSGSAEGGGPGPGGDMPGCGRCGRIGPDVCE
jgi:putative FmdB family regulatory protein